MAVNEQILYYHNDHLGTPRMLTDFQGTVMWDVDYEPFGKISQYRTIYISGSQPFRFPGQYEDSLTGLYYNWNRYYMSETGRYNRLEPSVSIFYSEYYKYSLNNPLNYYDISGEQSAGLPVHINRCFASCCKEDCENCRYCCDDCNKQCKDEAPPTGGHICNKGRDNCYMKCPD